MAALAAAETAVDAIALVDGVITPFPAGSWQVERRQERTIINS